MHLGQAMDPLSLIGLCHNWTIKQWYDCGIVGPISAVTYELNKSAAMEAIEKRIEKSLIL